MSTGYGDEIPDYEAEVTPLNLSSYNNFNAIFSLLNNDPDIENLSFTSAYQDQFLQTHFELRTHSKFANSVWTWCAGMMGPFVMITMAAAGQPWWLVYPDAENWLSSELKKIEEDAKSALADTRGKGFDELDKQFQAGVFQTQIDIIDKQLTYINKESQAFKKAKTYREAVIALSVIMVHETIDCNRIYDKDEDRKKHWDAFKFLTGGDDNYPTEAEFKYYQALFNKDNTGSPYRGAFPRNAFLNDDFKWQVEKRKGQLTKFYKLLKTRRRYYELLKGYFVNYGSTPESGTEGTQNNNIVGATNYNLPNVEHYDGLDLQAPQGPNSWVANAKLPPTASIPGFNNSLKELKTVQNSFNRSRNVSSALSGVISVANKAAKKFRELEENGEIKKHLDNEAKNKPNELASLNKAREHLKNFFSENKAAITSSSLFGKSLKDAELAKHRSAVKNIAKDPAKANIEYEKKGFHKNSSAKMVFGSSAIVKKKNDEPKPELVQGKGLNKEQIQAMLVKNQDPAGSEVSKDRNSSLFRQIHERYLKSIHRLFNTKKD